MNNTKRLTCLAMVVIIFTLSVITVSAITVEGYAVLNGSVTQDDRFLVGTVSVGRNPDSARLRIKFGIYYNMNDSFEEPAGAASTYNSAVGATSFTRDYLMYTYNELNPRKAFITYEVHSGGLYEGDYYTDSYVIDQSVF